MLKKSFKKIITSVILGVTLAVPMVAASTSPVEVKAATTLTYVENQSFMNCYNRYKENNRLVFNIKVKSGYLNLIKVNVYDSSGDFGYTSNVDGLKNYGDTTVTDVRYNDNGYDYCTIRMYTTYPGSPRAYWYGAGIKLFYDGYYNGNHIMATNTSNGSSVEGIGYFLYN